MIKLSLIASLFFLLSSHAFASENYFINSGVKFVSGVTNAATGFTELPKTIIVTTQTDGPLYGFTAGIAQGLLHTVGRSLIGIHDAATFMIPTNSPLKPLYVWQDLSTESSY